MIMFLNATTSKAAQDVSKSCARHDSERRQCWSSTLLVDSGKYIIFSPASITSLSQIIPASYLHTYIQKHTLTISHIPHPGLSVMLVPSYFNKCYLVAYLAGFEPPPSGPLQIEPDLCMEFEACLDKEEKEHQKRATLSPYWRIGAELLDVFLTCLVVVWKDIIRDFRRDMENGLKGCHILLSASIDVCTWIVGLVCFWVGRLVDGWKEIIFGGCVCDGQR